MFQHSVALERQRFGPRCDRVDGQCAVTFDLSLERMMSMRVGQCRHVTIAQETTVNNQENTRRCTNAQQLRRDSVLQQARQHSISVGMV